MPDEIAFDEEFLERLEALKLLAARAAGGRIEGSRIGTGRGGHVEFKDFRKYSPGDEIRYVDWNVYARIGKLFIKEFAREEESDVALLVDASASMGFGTPTKFTMARRVAAALAYVGLAGMDAVTVAAFAGGEVSRLPVSTGTAQIHGILEGLERLHAAGASDLGESVKRLLGEGRLRGTAVVISDLWDDGGALAPLRVMAEHRLDVVLIHLLSPQEVDPEAAGRLTMTDAETGAAIPANVGARSRAEYASEVQAWLAEVEAFASQHGIRYVRATTDTPFEELVLHYLTRGKVLG